MAASPARLQFSEAIDFFKGKLRLPSSGWTDIYQQQHSHAFIVAGAANDALVEDFYNAVRQAQEGGTGYPAFRQRFGEITAKYGWAHNGSPGWRSKVIYDTNITQAYNAGRYKQMMDVVHLRPFWEYVHTSTEHPRLHHLAWNGTILPADSPWWNTHFASNGWGCKCKIISLSRGEAKRRWEAKGNAGPDDPPPIEWEERIVGKNGSNPRTVRVPKGIDPGFAYNPGKAWLEPQTVPPLQGYGAVLKERGASWPTGFTPPAAPVPTSVPKSLLLAPNTPPEAAVKEFLDVFGASMERGAAFTDAAGTTMAITKALFQDGAGELKWLTNPDKASRLEYTYLLAMTLVEPDEIWWNWEKSRAENGRWLLKRRYLRAFELEGSGEYGVVAFEWGRTGWTGSTAFVPDRKSPENRAAYFDRQRIGRLLFKK
ncbi:PBECR2 nuclease fold domain-containing protein [Herbaspirillum sp.]|uniref:PBECR2 nuclease fold domain-containing protein n=1 Tax=Herbaspirillum sp. TaxID=1890675 RepID=UPI001B1BF9C1|nr:PBECR2 nuclease fold domain-containing protein [Herbaspirillum sp.]MBO9538734.1 hypothetical protein [Herbaspirillum sp.]